MKKIMFRALVFTHRYIGIGVGWLLLLWCVSGMVMMYVRYPELSASERHAALPTLDIKGNDTLPAALFAADAPLASVTLESVAGRTMLSVARDFGPVRQIDWQSGQVIESISDRQALQIAQQYLQVRDTVGAPKLLGLIQRDQWTVYGRYDRDRPMYHLALQDAAGTELYVSSITGRLVQKTERRERFWNWLGAVPHWLYFTALRQHTAVWSQLVIWTSVLGTFLAGFGLYLGVWQLRRKADQWQSPYRGWKYWHHVPGLLFGTLVLTWVVSGLLSMNPWGWLESEDAGQAAYQLRGELPTWRSVRESLAQLPMANLPLNTVSIESHVINGELAYVLGTRSGAQQRVDAQWNVAPLSDAIMTKAANQLSPGSSWTLLTVEDDYYYSHGRDVVAMPVLRVMSNAADASRYYLDAVSGELLRKVDVNARWYRWLHSGLHRMDFKPFMRERPFWDLLVWVLLGGVTLVCATGTWLGIRRLRGR